MFHDRETKINRTSKFRRRKIIYKTITTELFIDKSSSNSPWSLDDENSFYFLKFRFRSEFNERKIQTNDIFSFRSLNNNTKKNFFAFHNAFEWGSVAADVSFGWGWGQVKL